MITVDRLTDGSDILFRNKEKDNKFLTFLQHIYAIAVFGLGWVLFRASDIGYAVDYMATLFGIKGSAVPMFEKEYYVGNIEIMAFVAAFLCAVPLFGKMLDLPYERKWARAGVNVYLFLLFILSTMAIAGSTYNPFIYFRF